VKPDVLRALASAVHEERLIALVTILDGPGQGEQMLVPSAGGQVGRLSAPEVEQRALVLAQEHLAGLSTGRARLETASGAVELFVETVAPRPKLVVVGAVHAAIPLVSFARILGYRTLVVDPRSAFATRERFPAADELLVEWPQAALARIGLHEATCVAVLAHDPKIDLPALSVALRSPARYVGALGSRRTHGKRVEALRELGHSDEEIARIRAPIGLDLGGRSPEEIAVAIIAEIVAAAHR
jgi:xanthine dehydrogenase accessory factor